MKVEIRIPKSTEATLRAAASDIMEPDGVTPSALISEGIPEDGGEHTTVTVQVFYPETLFYLGIRTGIDVTRGIFNGNTDLGAKI